jgi:predicted AAA+ superfamily ATPase
MRGKMETIRRFFQLPEESFFLFGPRGTGKTTLVKSSFPDALMIDLLAPDTYRVYSARPETLREKLLAVPNKKIVIIDEIQKVPELLDLVHALIEEKKGVQFILTGSSSRKLKRKGVDLLAGRALLFFLHPFMASELNQLFSLPKAINQGLLPVVVDAKRPAQVLKTYISLYLREEVQMEGLVRKIGNFSRFLEAISFSHGSILNISNVARECQIERKLVEGYVSILEDLLISFRLNVFTRRAKRQLAVHPKFYLFDAGVYRSLRPKGPLDSPSEIDGQALEGLVCQHLQAWISYTDTDIHLYFWRTRSGSEIDFIVYGAPGLFAIEVKNSRHIHPKDLNALNAFKIDYPEAKLYFLYRGDDKLMKGSILCMPCEDFLLQLRPGRWVE